MKHFQIALCAVLSCAAVFLCAAPAASSPAATLWNELRQKREALTSLHQEFEVSSETKTATSTQASKRSLLIDTSHSQWREKSVAGSGNHLRIFDGSDTFYKEEDGEEFVRTPHRPKQDLPVPAPYAIEEPDWARSREIERRPCGIKGQDHQCAILEVPLNPHMRSGSGGAATRVTQGVERMRLDVETGILLQAVRTEWLQQGTRSWQSTVRYTALSATSGDALDPDFAKLPPGLKEVKELPRWNAARLTRQLVAKPAPELSVRDINGNPVSLADFRGRTVLLDFWTTWCPPCRADAPALDKLYRKYKEHDLMIVGISVNEDHSVVEKYLADHPHSYPVVLTTENDMPRPYQVGAFPTYIVIEKDGTVTAAAEGDQGFGTLRKLLKKAGLEVD